MLQIFESSFKTKAVPEEDIKNSSKVYRSSFTNNETQSGE